MTGEAVLENRTIRSARTLAFVFFFIIVNTAGAGSVYAQSSGGSAGPSQTKAHVDLSSYAVGPGDILIIAFANSPELNQKIEVGPNGNINVPLLSTPMHVAGLTALQISDKIAKALDDAKQLNHPYVNVFVEERNSHVVTVSGQVKNPGVYPLTRPTNLMDALSLAGGATTSAGATVTVTHADYMTADGANPDVSSNKTVTVPFAQLNDGGHPTANIEIHSGDVVNVSTAPLVYVVGAVSKPGGFVLQDPASGLTVLQAIALAEGLTSTAAPARGLVIRHPRGANKELIPIDLNRLMKGKGTDQELEANDILFVPESQAKKTLAALERTAEESVAEITGYGMGIRISK